MGATVKVSCRLDAGLVKFLDDQVAGKQRKGLRADRSQEVAIAIRHRQISMLPEAQRKALFAKLKIA